MRISRPEYGLEEQIMETIFILHEKKSSQPFKQPVDTNVYTDYLQRIKRPMDLSTIVKNLKNGVYKKADEISSDLLQIVRNCITYNAVGDIVKKAHQFSSCIETVWSNFKRQLVKKQIDYEQPINITEDVLRRLNFIEEKKTKKKIPGLQIAIEKDRRNILPEVSRLPPIEYEAEREKEELPPQFHFQYKNYVSLSREERQAKLIFAWEKQNIKEEFDQVASKKIEKYKKILKKKIRWCEEKIIQKCLQRKKFKKMQIPNHLSASIEEGKIAEELNIRKIQMYVKQITYWIEDNSNVLSDYMKDKYVECCRSIRKCLFRVIKYKKIPKTTRLTLDNVIYSQLPLIHEENVEVPQEEKNYENEKEDDSNYENKMKEFRRMLDKDRGESAKRDTKIILKNQNGEFQVIDWTSDKAKDRIRKDGGKAGNQIPDQDEKRKIEERKKEEIRKDEEFIEDYSKKSNVLLIGKHGANLKINWAEVMMRKYELPTQILFNPEESKQLQFQIN